MPYILFLFYSVGIITVHVYMNQLSSRDISNVKTKKTKIDTKLDLLKFV